MNQIVRDAIFDGLRTLSSLTIAAFAAYGIATKLPPILSSIPDWEGILLSIFVLVSFPMVFFPEMFTRVFWEDIFYQRYRDARKFGGDSLSA